MFAALVCFAAYASITAFRKAFNVAPYDGYQIWGLDYKVVLVITQVAGYMASKFYGIKFISELKKMGRGKLIIFLVGVKPEPEILHKGSPPFAFIVRIRSTQSRFRWCVLDPCI